MRIAFGPALSAVKAFLNPIDPVVQTDAYGMTQLEGWENIPESRIPNKARANQLAGASRLALFGFEGAHAGEIYFVKPGVRRLGGSIENDIVLTPLDERFEGEFEIRAEQTVTLTAVGAHPFSVNGRSLRQARLFDFDEVELNGNRFIVLFQGEGL